MKKYESYKIVDSVWITDMPGHWKYQHLRSIYYERKESNDPVISTNILSLSAKHGVELYSEKQHGGGNRAKDDLTKYHIARPGDLIVNCMNVISGSVGLSNYIGVISPVYYALVIRNELYNKFYYNYLFHIETFQKSLLPLGKGILIHESSSGKLNTIRMRIAMTNFNRVNLPVPPRDEQDQIVKYLDWKVSNINHLINSYQKEISLLKEKRKKIVTMYVTGDFDENVLVDSEIYWLLGVPSNWRITKLKWILQKQDRPIPKDAELLICSNNGEVKKRGDSKLGLVASSDDIYQGVKKGDLLIHGMDTWHGAIAISNYDGMCTPVVHVCITKESKRFICYYLQMMAYTKIFKAISNGVRQNTSDFRSWDKAGSIMIPLPDLDEQERIADIIDNKTAEIDKIISSIEKKIEYLREYRTRLISDVVTGQIDVREEKIPDYTPEGDSINTDDSENYEESGENDYAE